MATIPKQLYVTIQYRKDANNDGGLLGFASPYTKDAAFEKRKRTQESWAYGAYDAFTITDEDSVTFDPAAKTSFDVMELFAGNCYPQIVNNEPIEGFEIAKSVRRYGWSGSGNVVWRITDPRGYDLEISSENLASVLACSTMENGVIRGKCVWGREGSKNILLPEASEPYQAAIAETQKVNSKVSLKDVAPGDEVVLLSNKLLEDDDVAVYYGKCYFLTYDIERSNEKGYSWTRYSTGKYTFAGKQEEKYLFRTVKSGTYVTISTPKISSIVKKAEKSDKVALIQAVNAELAKTACNMGDLAEVILVSPTKIKPEDVKFRLVDADYHPSKGKWPKARSYYKQTFVIQNPDGTLGITTTNTRGDRNGAAPEDFEYISTVFTPNFDGMQLDMTLVRQQRSYYNSQPDYHQPVIKKGVLSSVFKQLEVVYNEQVGRLNYIYL